MTAIQITNLTKVFNPPFFSRQASCRALDHLSFEIQKGSIYTILGPNGAGKTTLIRILAGILPASEGRVALSGRTGLFLSGTQGFWVNVNGRVNLNYFCALQNIVGLKARKKVDEVICLFGMDGYIHAPVYTYSSGMKHRLLLARTLLNDPDILLLDEPVATLDPIAARDFHLLLRDRLNRALKKTIFLSTHQLEEAQEISDTLGFLFRGRLLWEKNAELFRTRQADLLGEYFDTVKGQLA